MPKSVRLINVDECVTSSGKVVKWADHAPPPVPKADGHSASASHVLIGGGRDQSNNYQGSVEIKSFSSTAQATTYSSLWVSGSEGAAASNGDYALFTAGREYASNVNLWNSYEHVSKVAYSSGSRVNYAYTNSPRYSAASGSDGDNAMFYGARRYQ